MTEPVRKHRLLQNLNRKPWATVVPDDLWAPVTGALLIFLVGVLGLAALATRIPVLCSLPPDPASQSENCALDRHGPLPA